MNDPCLNRNIATNAISKNELIVTWDMVQREYAEINDYIKNSIYKNILSSMCHANWTTFVEEIKDIFSGPFKTSFLHHPRLLQTMVRTDYGKPQMYEVDYLRYCLSAETSAILLKFKETSLGELPIVCDEYMCTVNSLGHLYYTARIIEKCSRHVDVVVEFGGGYGNFARIFKQIHPDTTYIIFDLPEILALQSFFIRSSLVGIDVVVHKVPPTDFTAKAIHLVPVCFVGDVDLKCELFVSTFALSESTKAAQEMIIKKDFFSAKYSYITGQIDGWGENHKWEHHSTIISSVRNKFSVIDCQPFHIFSESIHSYELTATRNPLARHQTSHFNDHHIYPKTVVVFISKDRAFQLDAALKSFFSQCSDANTICINVYYKASSPQFANQYLVLERDYSCVRFIPERNIKNDFITLIKGYDYFLGTVDDNVFIQPFSIRSMVAALELKPESLGFSLRLGKNTTYCYMSDTKQKLPQFFADEEGFLSYDWTTAEHDFGYAIEISSTIYRVADFLPIYLAEDVRTAHDLEAKIFNKIQNFTQKRPLMFCHKKSVLFSAPLNITKSDWTTNRQANRQDFSLESLAQLFDQGIRIDVEKFNGFVPVSCHQEVELEFEQAGKGKRPASNPSNIITSIDTTPMVSIVIPCYNQGMFLSEAVKSIITQTFNRWEIIIVNDGSPDNTSEVASQLIAQYPEKRIRLIEKPNTGVEDARNCGIRAASASWILPLDADDLFASTFLESAFAIINSDSAVNLVFSNLLDFGAKQGNGWTPDDYTPTAILEVDTFPYSSLYKKSLWEKVGGYPQIPLGAEDWCFWIACSRIGLNPRRVQERLFLYRHHANESNRTVKMMNNWETVKAIVHSYHADLYSKQSIIHDHGIISQMSNEVLLDIDKIIRNFPSNTKPYLWRGLRAEYEEDYNSAINLYEKTILLDSNDWQPFLRLSYCYDKLANIEDIKFKKIFYLKQALFAKEKADLVWHSFSNESIIT